MFNFILFCSRVAASKALAAILKEVPLWSENFPDEKNGTEYAVKSERHDVDVKDEPVDIDIDLATLSWENVEKFGHENQVLVEEPVNFYLPKPAS